MSFIETLQTQSKEEAQAELFSALNDKAMVTLSDMQEEGYDNLSKLAPFRGVGGARHREDDEGYHSDSIGYRFNQKQEKSADSKGTSSSGSHAVHINGKKWKSFDTLSHATNVARKISGATVVKEALDEGVRKVDEYSAGRHKATTHKDSDTGEYQVKFHTDGKHLSDADYFTDDKTDASGTAKSQVDYLNKKDTKAK